MRAIAVDVAARAFATRDDREGSLVATSMESEEEVGVVTRAMTRVRVGRGRMMRIRGGARGGSRAGAREDADAEATAVDEDALFSESAMEGSLRGGANAFVDSMDDGGLETIKFESALASAEDDARLEEDGRRPPTPGKARAWLVKEGGGRDASPTRGEEESTGTRAAAGVLKSPKRNGSMQFLTAVDDETRSRLVATPVLLPRVRSIDAGSLGSPSGSISERSMEIDGGETETGATRVSSSLCASSTLSNASAFSPVASRSVSRNASMVDVSKMKHT
mgnify:CR=1 FL=1